MKPKLLIVTEAALEHPLDMPLSLEDQARVNGVYRTYENFLPTLRKYYDVESLTPFDYGGMERRMLSAIFNKNSPFSAPGQGTIRLVMPSKDDISSRIEAIDPNAIHIATEGPLGMAAMKYAKANNLPVTTAFHTNWQQYVLEHGFHLPIMPKKLVAIGVKSLLTKFHSQSSAIMAATPELRDELTAWGLEEERIHIVSRGIDPDIFKPYPETERFMRENYVLNVGRIAPGKGVEDFCKLDTGDKKKVVVGTGPLAGELRAKYKDVHFAGFAEGANLGRWYAGADMFVLPSDTETFGITVIESLACGTPVVALNRGGHQPILNAAQGLGVMRPNLQDAFNAAAHHSDQFLDREAMAAFTASTRSWEKEAERFVSMIESVRLNHPAFYTSFSEPIFAHN